MQIFRYPRNDQNHLPNHLLPGLRVDALRRPLPTSCNAISIFRLCPDLPRDETLGPLLDLTTLRVVEPTEAQLFHDMVCLKLGTRTSFLTSTFQPGPAIGIRDTSRLHLEGFKDGRYVCPNYIFCNRGFRFSSLGLDYQDCKEAPEFDWCVSKHIKNLNDWRTSWLGREAYNKHDVALL